LNIQPPDSRLIGFIHHLRHEGFVIGIQETIDSMTMLNCSYNPDESLSRHIIRSLTCRDHAEWQRFDELFSAYWFPYRIKKNESNMMARIYARQRRGGIAGIGGSSKEHVDKLMESADISGAGAGRQRTISKADFRFLNDARAAREAERQAERLALLLRKKLKRRRVITTHGDKIDIRKSLRSNLKFGGLPVKPAYTQRRREPPHIIILHDVSHSMAWNNPLLFRFARGIVRAFPASEAFAFHTRLFCVTGLYRERSLEIMRSRLEASNHLWLGGTCIADSLAYFNKHHARQAVRHDSIIMILSDGFDTNDPKQLGSELENIKSRARQIIWLNPMLGRDGFAPDETFMQFAAPHIDRFAPAHSLAALEDAIRYLAGYRKRM
jgi:uncharacterized protein with von Willebrand factor type A (vWA) domain